MDHARAKLGSPCSTGSNIEHQSSVCISKPERSLGSNQVDFGGMIRPASATRRSWSMVQAGMAKAMDISPELTRFSNSPVPRMPPTKSILASVRMSPMPRIGLRMRF